MQAFLCGNCPLAFEIGGYSWWNLDGFTDRLVCVKCGTMHWLDFHRSRDAGASDPGVTILRALPEPIRSVSLVTRRDDTGSEYEDFEWPYRKDAWITVDTWPGRHSLESLSCHYCHVPGKLISLESPKTEDGRWPIFRDKKGINRCPICENPIKVVYDMTIN